MAKGLNHPVFLMLKKSGSFWVCHSKKEKTIPVTASMANCQGVMMNIFPYKVEQVNTNGNANDQVKQLCYSYQPTILCVPFSAFVVDRGIAFLDISIRK